MSLLHNSDHESDNESDDDYDNLPLAQLMQLHNVVLNHPLNNPESDNESSDSDDLPLAQLMTRRSRRRTTSLPASLFLPISGVDLTTSLPDSLLIHVLSLLPIGDAVKTQVLSRQWQHLWTYTTSLVFLRDSDFWDKSVSNFVTFVDKTLVLCHCSKLKKLGVQFAYSLRYDSNINLWARFATERRVEELQLDFKSTKADITDDDVDFYLLPQHLYTNSSFKTLQFSMCNVMPKGGVCWNSLKKLSIGYAKLSEDVIQQILAGSPVLEILELYNVYGFNRLHVSNASLKKLIMRDVWKDEEEKVEEDRIDGGQHSLLEISGPHLHSLEISGCWAENFRLGDLSSLVDANLTFRVYMYEDYSGHHERHPYMLRRLLQSLVHVKKITLGYWCLQVLSIMEAKCLSSPLLKCEWLSLDTAIRKSVLPGIAHMLESSPKLDTLVISVPSIRYSEDWGKLRNFGGKHYWTSRKESFTCLLFRVQKVKFIGFEMKYGDNYLSFVQFLLKNAMVLQEMVIHSRIRGYSNRQKEFSRAAQELLSFPRSSPNAVVLVYGENGLVK